MKLITDIIEESRLIVEDAENGSKNYFIEGIFMQSGVKNRNGRIYPNEVLDGQVSQYNENFVKRGRAMGELGHPENPTVNLERVSHNIVKLNRESSNDVMGRAKLLDTPYGNIAKSLVREGIQLGVSSRGLGSIKESGGAHVVQNDFYLAAVDIVADPSAPSAFVNGIMENKEWVLVDGVLTEQDIQRIKDDVNEAARSGRTEQEVVAIFQKLLR